MSRPNREERRKRLQEAYRLAHKPATGAPDEGGNLASAHEMPASPEPFSEASPTTTSLIPQNQTSTVLVFTRSAFVLNLLVGMVRLMQGISFWWTIALGYAFFVLMALELWFEPSTKKVRVLLLPLVVAGTIWFSVSVVFVSAPLDISAVTFDGNYELGTKIEGITWAPWMSELRVALANPSARDYEGINLIFHPGPNDLIHKVVQTSKFYDVSISLEGLEGMTPHITKGPQSKTDVPTVVEASSLGFRITCDKLRAYSRVNVLAVVGHAIIPLKHPHVLFESFWGGKAPPETLVDGVSSQDMGSWGQRRKLEYLRVSGSYSAVMRTRTIDQVLINAPMPPVSTPFQKGR